MNTPATVCVIDDEPMVLEVTSRLLRGAGFHTVGFSSADEFLLKFNETPCECIVTDQRMPGIKGEELVHRLKQAGSVISVIVLTGHADVRTAVRMMEEGALTLLEKPYEPQVLLATVQRAVQVTAERRKSRERSESIQQRLSLLTGEEREVMECMIAEMPIKAIAAKLILSTRTVERRRLIVLEKMQVGGVAELAMLMAERKSQVPPLPGSLDSQT